MSNDELQTILQKHERWLNDEPDGEQADLRGANLRGADLRETDLRETDLRGADLSETDLRSADLRGADIDFSCWPLWCGGLNVKIDDRIATQLLYHLLSCVQVSGDVSDEIRSVLLSEPVVAIANRFHRVKECGKIYHWDPLESQGDINGQAAL